MVNLEWYRTFKAIYQNGNLTRAAEELFISQPNVSVQLASLESYIGQKLFERLPRKLVPTEYGKILYTQVVESVENLERVEVEFRKTALNKLQNMQIGSPIEYAHHILLKNINNCQANISLQFGMARELITCLEKKELDFVIATQKIDSVDIVYEPLVTENFMIIANSTVDTTEFEEYIAADNMNEAEKWLLGQRWIVYDNKLSIVRRFWKENFEKRPLIKPHYTMPNISMMIDAVGMNYGITVVSDLFVEEERLNKDIQIVWRGKKLTNNQLWLAYKPLQVDPRNLDEIRKILRMEAEKETNN